MLTKFAGSRGCKIKLFSNLIIVTSMATIMTVMSTSKNNAANVTFSGNITDDNNNGGGDPDPDDDDPALNGSCTIQISRNGSFGAVSPVGGINPTALDSRGPDGLSAQLLVSTFLPANNTTRGFRITLEAPSIFATAPAGANANIQFNSFFSGSSFNNGIDFPEQNGEDFQELSSSGVSATLITGHLRASKLVGELPAGTYQAVSVFRCE